MKQDLNKIKELQDYVQVWHQLEGIKPQNENPFIDRFIHLLESLDDDRDIRFYGEGAYFGKQITLHLNSGVWIGDSLINFEIAYSKDAIRVYTANHEGFWTPEYLSMNYHHERFKEVRDALFKRLYKVFGLPSPLE